MHFDQNKSVGALGTLIVAKWYRAGRPLHLLISLDSAETRRWMNLDDDAQRADLLGLSIENKVPVIDLIESKASLDESKVYTFDRQGRISGRPVEQLLNTGHSVEAIFGLNEWKDHVLTPPRKEILRNHLYRQGFSGNRTKEEKQFWQKTLNALFSGELKPVIRLNLVVVNLSVNQDPLDQIVDTEKGKIRLVHINEEDVRRYLGGHSAPLAQTDAEPEPGSAKEKLKKEKRASKPAKEDEKAKPSQEEETSGVAPPPGELAEQIRVTCGKIKAACQDFGIKVTEIDPKLVEVGPSILRYKIRLAPGEDAARMRRQAENIARQLEAERVPIMGFLPGTNYEYLDLARPDRQVVSLEPLLSRIQLRDINDLPLFVGVDPAGSSHRLDLGDDRLPHILVAGGTGSGKTIFLYTAVLSLVSAHSEKNLELVIIDPKQTDFTIFGELAHLRNKEIVSDADKGVTLVRSIAEHDMHERSETLQAAKCRDIKAYNLTHPKKMIRPLVVIIDEYADLVSVLPKREKDDFERTISRLTARGRNVGIHLVIATQRPTVEVVTGNIKANMPCRISFSLPSSRDSQVILDEPGAERLLRNGDMLLLLEGKLTRLQGYFVDPKRIESLLP